MAIADEGNESTEYIQGGDVQVATGFNEGRLFHGVQLARACVDRTVN